jgi:hypothetical protein
VTPSCWRITARSSGVPNSLADGMVPWDPLECSRLWKDGTEGGGTIGMIGGYRVAIAGGTDPVGVLGLLGFMISLGVRCEYCSSC